MNMNTSKYIHCFINGHGFQTESKRSNYIGDLHHLKLYVGLACSIPIMIFTKPRAINYAITGIGLFSTLYICNKFTNISQAKYYAKGNTELKLAADWTMLRNAYIFEPNTDLDKKFNDLLSRSPKLSRHAMNYAISQLDI